MTLRHSERRCEPTWIIIMGMAMALARTGITPNQVTFLLKGDLKNARIAYIRAAVKLARVRDEKLWQALGHRSLEQLIDFSASADGSS